MFNCCKGWGIIIISSQSQTCIFGPQKWRRQLMVYICWIDQTGDLAQEKEVANLQAATVWIVVLTAWRQQFTYKHHPMFPWRGQLLFAFLGALIFLLNLYRWITWRVGVILVHLLGMNKTSCLEIISETFWIKVFSLAGW